MSSVEVATALGRFSLDIREDAAPASAAYFLADVRAGLYDGSSFFRIVTLANQRVEEGRRIEVIQGGFRDAREDLPPVIPHETTAMTGLRHLKGTVSLARFAPGAVYHSFFICLRDEPALDFGGTRHRDGQGFAAFGRVTDGMAVVREIQRSSATGQSLTPPIPIFTIRRADK
jgi:peptidyl-prolyl cis-trans isomerase A (cyclophilin A)